MAGAREGALRAFVFEGLAPDIGGVALALQGVAHFGKLRPQEGDDLAGCVGWRRGLRCDGGIDAVQLGGLDLPLAMLVAGGGDLAGFDRPQDGRLICATSEGGGAESVGPGGARGRNRGCEQDGRAMVDEELTPAKSQMSFI